MWLLCYTFYNDKEDLVGIDAQPISYRIEPVALFVGLVNAPVDSVMAVVSLSDLETDEFEWIAAYDMVGINDQEN